MWFAFAALKSPGPLSGSAETVVLRDGAADGSGGMRLGRGGLPPLEQAGANRFLRGFPRPAKQSVKACVCHVAAGAIRPGLWRWAFRSARIFSVPRRRIPRSRQVTGPFIHCGPKRTKREFFLSCFIGDGASPSPRELQDKIRLSFKGGYSSSFHFLQCSILAP